MSTLIKVNQLRKTYGKGEKAFHAVDGISFELEQGEFIAVMGPSGSGKSTLLNLLSTIDRPTEGDIIVEGANLSAMTEKDLADFRQKKLGFIFQEYNLLDSLTVEENIMLPLAISKAAPQTMKQRVQILTTIFGIDRLLKHFPHQLSGGQKQRTAACRALVADPAFIFADEPTGALDSKSATDLLERLNRINSDQETTILMVTHDAYAASFCRRVMFIKDGCLFKELYRRDRSQNDFFKKILEEIATTGGETDEVH
ncbi:ABC transporter ATP-binding protein [Salisediminibacterium selenitireducens]|uniref:ABC transporter related protein n=1 Tax=Bacillus selenitireducens (strain ATCC 700615 / DSM 15326 / MLS10) TaxID=439292 RepID=D6XXV8_BACIE|nr:ABC transporter ATP-binding protein [Salisediminibacterium selenitireducens]ADI00151.1 ABC transporter related protein [[Bacillus] selenitireducens MLS10]